MKNNMEQWNTNDWQGKRKDQVDASMASLVIAVISIAVITLIAFAVNTLK